MTAVAVAVIGASGAARAQTVAPGAEGLFADRCGVCHSGSGPGVMTLAKRLGKDKSLIVERTVFESGLCEVRRPSRPERHASARPRGDHRRAAGRHSGLRHPPSRRRRTVKRRDVLKGAAVAAWGLGPGLAEAAGLAVAVFDSRHNLSRRWALRQPVLRRVDARSDILRQWRELKMGSPATVVSGLTTWAGLPSHLAAARPKPGARSGISG